MIGVAYFDALKMPLPGYVVGCVLRCRIKTARYTII